MPEIIVPIGYKSIGGLSRYKMERKNKILKHKVDSRRLRNEDWWLDNGKEEYFVQRNAH